MIYGWYVTDVINLFSGLIFSWLLAIIMPIEIYSLISIAVAYSSIIQIFVRSNTTSSPSEPFPRAIGNAALVSKSL